MIYHIDYRLCFFVHESLKRDAWVNCFVFLSEVGRKKDFSMVFNSRQAKMKEKISYNKCEDKAAIIEKTSRIEKNSKIKEKIGVWNLQKASKS